jgi:TolA-binding protein
VVAAPTPKVIKPIAAEKPAEKPAVIAKPSAARIAAVKAIIKPVTKDPIDDEYSYGFRLYEAKFYPEAQQQLKMFAEKYPKHSRISYALNLLGRAYMDEGKPREGAAWFVQNFNSNKTGARAADSLLNLAEAMLQIKDTTRACIALGEFGERYAVEAKGRLKVQYDSLRSEVNCN